MSIEDKSKKARKNSFLHKLILIVIGVLVVKYSDQIITGLGRIVSLIIPLLIGFGLFYIWRLIVKPLEKAFLSRLDGPRTKKLRRPLAIIFSLIILIGILALITYLVLPQLFESFRILTRNLPRVLSEFQTWFLVKTEGVEWISQARNWVENISLDWSSIVNDLTHSLGPGLGGILGSTFSLFGSIAGNIVTGLTAIIFAIYFMSGKERLSENSNRFLKAYIPNHKRQKIYYVLAVANDTFSKFFKGQVLSAFVVGLLLFVTMTIFRLPYALSIGVLVMITALVPVVGSFVGGLFGFIMIAGISLKKAIIFIIILVLIQQFEGDFIYPRIMSDSLHLPGIWVFAAVFLGGALGGPLGMILAVPLIATIYKLVKNNVNQKVSEDDRRGLSEEMALTLTRRSCYNETEDLVDLEGLQEDAQDEVMASKKNKETKL